MHDRLEPSNLLRLAQQAAVVCAVAAAAVLLLLGIGFASDVLLMIFAALLFAIFLRGLSDPLASHTPLGQKWSIAGVVMVLLLILVALGFWLVPLLVEQVADLRDSLPKAVSKLQRDLEQHAWGQWIVGRIPETQELLPKPQALLTRTTGVMSTAFGAVGVLLVIFFVGLMFAFQPGVYREGLLQLVTPSERPRGREVLDRVGESLRWWLIAKAVAMVLVGLMTWLGLWLLGIQLAAALAVIAAILTFIPNFGPIISAVPAVLLGLMESPSTAVWVVVLFTAIQLIESYGITPLVQYRALSLPPALTITAQLVLGAWVGVLGLALATPLTAAAVVMIRMLYVHDVLGDRQSDG